MKIKPYITQEKELAMMTCRQHVAVVPFQLFFDKIAAIFLFCRHLACGLDDLKIVFCKTNYPDQQKVSGWLNQGAQIIDVGDRKYHTFIKRDSKNGQVKTIENHHSASRIIAEETGQIQEPEIARLIELIDDNNDCGSLKKKPWSVAKLVREMYNNKLNALTILKNVIHVLEIWLKFNQQNPAQRDEANLSLEEEFKLDIVKDVFGWNGCDFTIGQYAYQMFQLDCQVQEIYDRVSFFKTQQEQADAAQKQLPQIWKNQIKPEASFFLDDRGVAIETDNVRLSSYLMARQNFSVVVVKNSRGNVCVLIKRGSDFSIPQALADFIAENEERHWRIDQRIGGGCALNGSPAYPHVPATKLTVAQIIKMFEQQFSG